MVDNEQYYYVVKVVKTNYTDYEEEIFEDEYEANEDEDDTQACASALKIAYHGCVDED